VNTFVY